MDAKFAGSALRSIAGIQRIARPIMLSVRTKKKPTHERYAAQAKRLQQRISRLLERGEYTKVRELSELLQTLVRKAADAEKRSRS